MNKTIQKIIIIILVSSLGYYVYANYLTACSQVLAYDIGSVDPRFGITEDELVNLTQDTEMLWEKPFDAEFFRYDPDAEFKINLVFDDRQQRTIDERTTRLTINTQEQIYKNKIADYEALLQQHIAQSATYDTEAAAYEQRLTKYNQDVDYWNKNGGAPNKEYNLLQSEKASLQREARRLETERQKLNLLVNQLNTMANEINVMARELNYDVDAYNGKFGSVKEFDQGSYTGSSINIFQFNEKNDLKLVLAHELGHALGLEHIDEPLAVMYYLMDKQNIKNLKLHEADLNALRSKCKIR